MDVQKIVQDVSSVLKGKEEVITYSLVCFLSGGHLILEDVPGVGKTTLALAISKVLGLSFARVQFTSDLLPSDITGVSVYDQSKKTFVFKQGPIFHNIVLADEINRATPKTQSALLEAMAEGKVSVDGITYELPFPFFVIATQNPVEQYGTYPLPESQLDRFSMRLSLGYPDPDTEVQIIMGENPIEKVSRLNPAVKPQELISAIQQIKRFYVSPDVGKFVVEIVNQTRNHPDVLLGVSTRGAIHLVSCARALAYVKGRDFIVPEDVIELAPLVLPHRIITRTDSDPKAIIEEILTKVEVP
ncbi:ATPase associated with various cellular activities AAA_3 [Hydrogenobacter thermophilus TK-6]|uniref:MoxR-like ATPase n=1 Tax=Hydrogenobacter thermophilus (strain DSM 6534 / IAM 12695 / TK-6) TaxID=608538 RepID=D3DF85_HYDTT|nr:MoxR family ATPase [Hydrogenobacter thermophilus]ADO44431.1 ATPase associated with various cellular activities AAA_3 [Hydrogenobacter thermophilus TK-6]BAI68487.1 MoxR-like ATPase [Hydrogenobacter thermophilus TK-6]